MPRILDRSDNHARPSQGDGSAAGLAHPGSVEARGLLHLLVAADHRLLYTVRSDSFRFRTHRE
jgi:hypothetical protein